MKLYRYSVPEIYLNSIFEISTDKLFDSGYDTLLFDLDNTIISYSENIIDIKTSKFLKSLEKKFNIVIISNSPNLRVLKACKQFGLKFISSAKKPFKIGFRKALKIHQSVPEKTVMIGDQILTDIIGSNRLGIKSILVNPIKRKTDHVFTRINRKLEKYIINRIIKKYPNLINEALKEYIKKNYK